MLRAWALIALTAAQTTNSQTNTASGGVCERGWECQATEYCDFFNECRPRKTQGEYCTGDQPGDQLCVEDLTCDQRDHMCVLPVPKCGDDLDCQGGEYCDAEGTKNCFPVACHGNAQCSARYFCAIEDDARIGSCTQRARRGEQCGQTMPCAPGLVCQAGVCAALSTPSGPGLPLGRGSRTAGNACTRELDCRLGLYCKDGDPRSRDTGVCTAWSLEGQECDEATLCEQGQFCVVQFNYGDAGLCIPYQEKGYAKVRPGSTRWVVEGRPIQRSPPGFGMQDAGSVPVYADGRPPYVTIAPTSPPTAKAVARQVDPKPQAAVNVPVAIPAVLPASGIAPIPATPSALVSPSLVFSAPASVPPLGFSQQPIVPAFPVSSQPPTTGVAVPLPERRAVGSEPVCCEALTAACLSCQLRVTEGAFCATNPSVSGCNGLASVLTSPPQLMGANPVLVYAVAAPMPAPASNILATQPQPIRTSTASSASSTLPPQSAQAQPNRASTAGSFVPSSNIFPSQFTQAQPVAASNVLPFASGPFPSQFQPSLQAQPMSFTPASSLSAGSAQIQQSWQAQPSTWTSSQSVPQSTGFTAQFSPQQFTTPTFSAQPFVGAQVLAPAFQQTIPVAQPQFITPIAFNPSFSTTGRVAESWPQSWPG